MGSVVGFAELRAMCPDSFEALTVRQYQKLFYWSGDWFELFELLTGKKISDPNPEKEHALFSCLGWALVPIKFSKEVPKTIKIDDRTVEVPQDLGSLSVGQIIKLKQVNVKYIDEGIGISTAIGLQPLIDEKPFGMGRVKDIETKILDMKASEIYPIGFFLLKSAQNFGNGRQKSYQRTLNNLRARLERMLPQWLKRGGFHLSLTCF